MEDLIIPVDASSGATCWMVTQPQERGEPLTNVAITLTELQEHPVDSKKMAHHRAAVRALNALCGQPGALQPLARPARGANG